MSLRVAGDGPSPRTVAEKRTPAAPGRPYVELAGVAKTYRRGERETHAIERFDLAIGGSG